MKLRQPDGAIMQMAYVVPTLRTAIDHWITHLKVGPWFVLESFFGVDPVYRGVPSKAEINFAISFAGDMNIELIQPMDQNPSVYKELIDAKGYGFHHWGVASRNFTSDLKRYEAMGMELVFRLGMATGGEVAYFDSKGTLPGFVEVIETSPTLEQALWAIYHVTKDWDGRHPVRPFA